MTALTPCRASGAVNGQSDPPPPWARWFSFYIKSILWMGSCGPKNREDKKGCSGFFRFIQISGPFHTPFSHDLAWEHVPSPLEDFQTLGINSNYSNSVRTEVTAITGSWQEGCWNLTPSRPGENLHWVEFKSERRVAEVSGGEVWDAVREEKQQGQKSRCILGTWDWFCGPPMASC